MHGSLLGTVRPLKPRKEDRRLRNRPNQILFYLNDKELKILNQRVAKTGLSREAYLRSLIANTVPKEQPPMDFYDVMRELRQISINMNQIALKANTLNLIDAPFYSDCHKNLQSAIGKIMRTVYG